MNRDSMQTSESSICVRYTFHVQQPKIKVFCFCPTHNNGKKSQPEIEFLVKEKTKHICFISAQNKFIIAIGECMSKTVN